MYRVMVVDDDEDMRMLLSRWLGKVYEVETASGGREAITILKEKGADLVLLDYRMPDMDGMATLSGIKGDAGLKDIPVYFLTGEEDDAEMNEAREKGATGCIKKSEGKRKLMDTLEGFFNV